MLSLAGIRVMGRSERKISGTVSQTLGVSRQRARKRGRERETDRNIETETEKQKERQKDRNRQLSLKEVQEQLDSDILIFALIFQ